MLQQSQDETIPIFSVSHRRGGVVHKFIATCGTTLPGVSLKATFEDEEEQGNGGAASRDFELARKCPRVLNDATAAQPVIDRHNRYRQFILAMEKRLLTDRFALRFATTMHGILFTDAFFAYRYFKDSMADFKNERNKLAMSLINNPDISNESGSPQNRPQKQARRASPNSGGISSSSSDGRAHPLVKMKALPGYNGGKDGRQRCQVCNKKTLWCCLDCSDAPSSLFPLCPMESNKHGAISSHLCYDRHCSAPSWMPKGRASTGGNKRRRGAADDDDFEFGGSELDSEYAYAEDCEDNAAGYEAE
ncbi:hypothetical protein AB1Y20_020324 [Prymnesium parvum]|uniref:PiggyBac transposable element-derived protein domain-containing protein n=1 Tax=Prymnesium parvum TaxID=97485 RepID=A0AB34JXA2_PRYPA